MASELHRIIRLFGDREQLGPNSTIRYSVFVDFEVTNKIRYSVFVNFHERILFGIREQLGPNSTIRSSVFGNFSGTKIFGLRSSEIFQKRRSSVFGIRELLEPNSTNIFLFDIQMNVCNKYIVLPSFLKSYFSTFWYS